jgi:hypothetical protein
MSISSESGNEIRNKTTFDTIKVDFEKTFKMGLDSNLLCQTLNKSPRNVKKLKRKKNLCTSSDILHENKYSHLSYSFNPPKTNHNLSNSKNVSTNSSTKYKCLTTNTTKSVDLNKKFTIAIESSSDSDFPDLKYIKLISKDTEINTSSISNESRQSRPYSIKNKPFVYDSLNCSSSSSSLSNFSQINTESAALKNKNNHDTELNLDKLLLDCSLSDLLLIRKDDGDIDSQVCSTLDTSDNSFIRMKSKSPKPLLLNNSFRVDDDSQPQQLSNVTINIPDFMKNETEDKQNKSIDTIEVDGQHELINEHCKVIKKKSFLNEVDIKPSTRSNSYRSIEDSITSASSEHICKYCKRSSKSKVDTSNCSHKSSKTNYNKGKKLSKSKMISNKSDVLRLRKSYVTKKLRNRKSSTNIVEDIGLEYDTNKDNFMVELPNGTLVPEFLSTLKPKHVKKMCACGITPSEIPLTWDEKFHDILHQNIHKLWFKCNIIEHNTINSIHFKLNNLFYRILILNNNYNDESISESIENIDDFVCLEYGIFKHGLRSNKNSTYLLAILPNFKVIGYLEVKPINKAYRFTDDTQLLEETSIVKFGVSKIWVVIKYRNKNIDINLLNTFCEKKNIQKEDLAFSLNGCQGIAFIQKYTGNKNIFIYNEIPAKCKIE